MGKYARANTSALDAANYLIEVASREDEHLEPMQLQKLLYFAQCWFLADHGRKLFDDAFQAWSWGPVVPEVWKAHAGKRKIIVDRVYYEGLAEDQMEMLEEIWSAYREYSSIELSRMTHAAGTPWRAARGSIPDDVRSSTPLDLDAMRSHTLDAIDRENRWMSQNWDEIKKMASA